MPAMIFRFVMFLVLVTAPVASSSFAGPGSAQTRPDKRLEALFEKLNIAPMLDGLRSAYSNASYVPIESPPASGTSSEDREVRAAFKSALDPVEMRKAVRLELSQCLTAGQVRGILAFYDSPLGARLSREHRAWTMDRSAGFDRLMRLGDALYQLEGDRERKKLVERILSLSGDAAVQADILLHLSLQLAVGARDAIPAGQPRPDFETMRVQIQRAQRPVARALEIQTLAEIATMLRPFSLGELRRLRDYYTSPLGRAEVACVNGSIKKVIGIHAHRLGHLLAKLNHRERL